MKSLTRLFVLFLAAILCSTFLSACADTPASPVSDNTIDVLTTDEDFTDITYSPGDDVESESSENNDDQLYGVEGIYAKIKGSDIFRLPLEGYYIKYTPNDSAYLTDPEKSTFTFFVSNVHQLTNKSSAVPFKNEVFDGPHSCNVNNGVITISYNNGEKVLILPGTYSELVDFYISPDVSVVSTDTKILTIIDMGKTINTADYSGGKVYVDSKGDVCIISSEFNASGLKVAISRSEDDGKTFSVSIEGVDAFDVGEEYGWFANGTDYTTIENDPSCYKYISCGIMLQQPLFDGDTGVLSAKINNYGFVYFITLNGGKTWFKYDPEFLADINREQVNITYDSKISR